MKQMFFLFFTVLLLAMVGCGKNVAVTGNVSFEDGQPLTKGQVMFTDGTHSAFGNIDEKGNFKMGMIKDGDGVPPGSYKVYITGATKPSPEHKISTEEGDVIPEILAIDPKFTNSASSGWVCDVQGKMTYDLKVEKPGPNYKPSFSTTD